MAKKVVFVDNRSGRFIDVGFVDASGRVVAPRRLPSGITIRQAGVPRNNQEPDDVYPDDVQCDIEALSQLPDASGAADVNFPDENEPTFSIARYDWLPTRMCEKVVIPADLVDSVSYDGDAYLDLHLSAASAALGDADSVLLYLELQSTTGRLISVAGLYDEDFYFGGYDVEIQANGTIGIVLRYDSNGDWSITEVSGEQESSVSAEMFNPLADLPCVIPVPFQFGADDENAQVLGCGHTVRPVDGATDDATCSVSYLPPSGQWYLEFRLSTANDDRQNELRIEADDGFSIAMFKNAFDPDSAWAGFVQGARNPNDGGIDVITKNPSDAEAAYFTNCFVGLIFDQDNARVRVGLDFGDGVMHWVSSSVDPISYAEGVGAAVWIEIGSAATGLYGVGAQIAEGIPLNGDYGIDMIPYADDQFHRPVGVNAYFTGSDPCATPSPEPTAVPNLYAFVADPVLTGAVGIESAVNIRRYQNDDGAFDLTMKANGANIDDVSWSDGEHGAKQLMYAPNTTGAFELTLDGEFDAGNVLGTPATISGDAVDAFAFTTNDSHAITLAGSGSGSAQTYGFNSNAIQYGAEFYVEGIVTLPLVNDLDGHNAGLTFAGGSFGFSATRRYSGGNDPYAYNTGAIAAGTTFYDSALDAEIQAGLVFGAVLQFNGGDDTVRLGVVKAGVMNWFVDFDGPTYTTDFTGATFFDASLTNASFKAAASAEDSFNYQGYSASFGMRATQSPQEYRPEGIAPLVFEYAA